MSAVGAKRGGYRLALPCRRRRAGNLHMSGIETGATHIGVVAPWMKRIHCSLVLA